MIQNIKIGDKYPLDAILSIPDNINEKVPGVIFVHGSGPSDKDETIYKLKPFKDLSDALLKNNIASIRYDKRTFIYKNIKDLTVKEETIDDALIATNIIKNHPNIDPDKIFIIGHSMGGMLAPRIDDEGGNYKGIIMMASSPYRLEEIVIRQLRQASTNGFIIKNIIKLEEKIYSKKFINLYERSDEELKKKKFAGNLSLYYFKEMGLKTSLDYLKDLNKPILIMQGEKDFQVLKDIDYQRYIDELNNKDNIEFKLYPNLNHLFMNSIYNDILKANKEYKVIQHIPNYVINDIVDFINRNS